VVVVGPGVSDLVVVGSGVVDSGVVNSVSLFSQGQFHPPLCEFLLLFLCEFLLCVGILYIYPKNFIKRKTFQNKNLSKEKLIKRKTYQKNFIPNIFYENDIKIFY
jgi:hypothetical protein